MRYLQLPAIKIDLQQRLGFSFAVSTEQIGRLAIKRFAFKGLTVSRRSDHKQSQWSFAAPFSPQHIKYFLIVYVSPLSAVKYPLGFPPDLIVESDRFGSEALVAVDFSAFIGGKTQNGIFAGSGNQDGPFQYRFKHSAV